MSGVKRRPIEIVRKARVVIQQIAHRVLRHQGIHRRSKVGKDFLHRCVEHELIAVDQLTDEDRGHGLGIGAEMDRIGNQKWRRVADLANAGTAERDNSIAAKDGADGAGKFVFFGQGSKRRGEIARHHRIAIRESAAWGNAGRRT